MATLYFTASGGDELRITNFDTPIPALQVEGATCGDWRDVPPRLYPNALFCLAAILANVLQEVPVGLALRDASVRIEDA